MSIRDILFFGYGVILMTIIGNVNALIYYDMPINYGICIGNLTSCYGEKLPISYTDFDSSIFLNNTANQQTGFNLTVNWLYAIGTNLSVSSTDYNGDEYYINEISNVFTFNETVLNSSIDKKLIDNSPFFNNVTLNISGLQDNIGVVTTNITELQTKSIFKGTIQNHIVADIPLNHWIEAVSPTNNIVHIGYAASWVNNTANTTLNTPYSAVTVNGSYVQTVPYWVDDGLMIVSNVSINNGNVNISGNLNLNGLSSGSNLTFINQPRLITGKNGFLFYSLGDAQTFGGYYNQIRMNTKNSSLWAIFQISNNDSLGNGLSIRMSGTAKNNIQPFDNKATDLGFSGAYSASFDNCYCDDFVNTPRDIVSLTENNRGDFAVLTIGTVTNEKGVRKENMRIEYPNAKKSSVSYSSYLDALIAIPFNEGDGHTDYTSIPPMFRDKKGNDDTVSTYAVLMALRGAIIEKDAEIMSLKARLDKLEGVKT